MSSAAMRNLAPRADMELQPKPADPCVVVIFGAAVDLTRRLLVPALYNLRQARLLPEAFAVIGIARNNQDDETFRRALGTDLRALDKNVTVDRDDWKWRNPHVLNMSPPLSMKPHWFQNHVASTMAKYGMSECTLGHAAEFKRHGIAVNSLWPRTAIATAALQMIPGIDISKTRKPEILSDAAHLILTSDAKATTGRFFIDEALLAEHGVTDFDRYAVVPGTQDLIPDFFLD
jgi:NAD(P)-dependent dehydrogenase (short-subunit alcohol dehydrogenase family)